ncbi:hypothetical protein [Streptomyces sp. NPDC047009]|uniref:hypothetical protein n=1 Tax=Streptomyces sp. NPDC047009 TaxID=3154496 RepID=UPI00340E962E
MGQESPKKAAATSATKTASKKPAAKASSANASMTATKPTLVDLIRSHLEQRSEPRSAAGISSTLTQAHPDRSIKTTVVRTTLEGLVAQSHAHRTKQGSSVSYTAAAALAACCRRAAAGGSSQLSRVIVIPEGADAVKRVVGASC